MTATPGPDANSELFLCTKNSLLRAAGGLGKMGEWRKKYPGCQGGRPKVRSNVFKLPSSGLPASWMGRASPTFTPVACPPHSGCCLHLSIHEGSLYKVSWHPPTSTCQAMLSGTGLSPPGEWGASPQSVQKCPLGCQWLSPLLWPTGDSMQNSLKGGAAQVSFRLAQKSLTQGSPHSP